MHANKYISTSNSTSSKLEKRRGHRCVGFLFVLFTLHVTEYCHMNDEYFLRCFFLSDSLLLCTSAYVQSFPGDGVMYAVRSAANYKQFEYIYFVFCDGRSSTRTKERTNERWNANQRNVPKIVATLT